ncbi:MAG: DUF4236 domain-containing protein [Pirellulales bacterium]
MGWRWRKVFSRGPFRANVSGSGVGWSFGIPGLRYGRSPSGRAYISVGFPGLGLYWIKYLGSPCQSESQQPGAVAQPQTTAPANTLPANHATAARERAEGKKQDQSEKATWWKDHV